MSRFEEVLEAKIAQAKQEIQAEYLRLLDDWLASWEPQGLRWLTDE